MDGSKRSGKANAFFTGFGPFRRLVLFDTLIQKHTLPELIAVLAHEVGHFKRQHILRTTLFSLVLSGLTLYGASIFLNNRNLFDAFRMTEVSTYAGLVFIGFLYAPIGRVVSVLSLMLSRKFEYEADEFAVRTYGDAQTLISALKKLSVDNLSYLTPHALKVVLEYSHPPILQRIQALAQLDADRRQAHSIGKG